MNCPLTGVADWFLRAEPAAARRERAEISISAMFSQLPCFGVRWGWMRRAHLGEQLLAGLGEADQGFRRSGGIA
ncbi:MAG: hypothetical protein R3F11_18960 [Verrucomicrobiales bacterium]